MEALFPLKIDNIDIPDNPENLVGWLKRDIICFLFSSEAKKEEIKIYSDYNIYYLGEILKEQKQLNIYYIEASGRDINSNSKVEIEVQNQSFFLTIKGKLNRGKNFLFNQLLFDEKNKKSDKINYFDINEEFEIYYRIHSMKKNNNSLKSLIASVINIFKNGGEESNFSFFLTALINDDLKLMEKENLDDILSKIKNIGDLSKISKKKISKIATYKEGNRLGQIILSMYFILSKDVKGLEKYLTINIIRYDLLIEYFDKYKNLFLHSIELFPELTFLIDKVRLLDDIKIILKCSKSLTDFIYTVNEKKESILRAKKKIKMII